EKAAEKKLKVALNPSPYTENIKGWPLGYVSLFFVNEIEGAQLTGSTEPDGILDKFAALYPQAGVVLTLGARGSAFQGAGRRIYSGGRKVTAVDTTAAGDTFTGYFLHCITSGRGYEEALELASYAAAIAVSSKGAEPSIPWMKQLI
ncbi:MAG: PfkB family carbohydrate kinase, partial [Clostridiales bacterium]|nr:PfkB family carbohydrate kinase [Clostridiales bacterium]